MDMIVYMWKFKPDETKDFKMDVVKNNQRFIPSFRIATPPLVESLLKTDEFPTLYDLYLKIPNWVVKTDLGRLLIVYFYGGLYSDADCFIQKNINNNKNILLFTEKICKEENLGPREAKIRLRVANYCFGSKVKRHPFLKEVIDECLRRLHQLLIVEQIEKPTPQDILWVCGPDVITTIYHNSKNNYDDIYLFDQSFLNHKCYGSWR